MVDTVFFEAVLSPEYFFASPPFRINLFPPATPIPHVSTQKIKVGENREGPQKCVEKWMI